MIGYTSAAIANHTHRKEQFFHEQSGALGQNMYVLLSPIPPPPLFLYLPSPSNKLLHAQHEIKILIWYLLP